VNAQLDLLAMLELERGTIWRQLPEESRQTIGGLFARLILAYAAARAGEEVSDECS
jgi:hypothetical protein